MRRIVLFFDGTRYDTRRPRGSNVLRLCRAVSRIGPDGATQIVHYFPGLGTGTGTGRLAKGVDWLAGAGFGAGYLDRLATAYRDVLLNYEPGDELFIFGWSRGAYLARRLVEFLRIVGLMDRADLYRVPTLARRFLATSRIGRTGEDGHPDSHEVAQLRMQLSPQMATGARDMAFREEMCLPAPVMLKVDFLGLWDCVSAIGVPMAFPLLRRLGGQTGLDVHDLSLSAIVAASRHAVSADECRAFYPSSPFDNLDVLNEAAGARSHRQQVFPGDHSVVGGDVPESCGLTDANLLWVAEGAAEAGLCLDAALLTGLAAGIDPLAPLGSNAGHPTGAGRWSRTGLVQELEASEVFRARQAADPGYWPGARRGA